MPYSGFIDQNQQRIHQQERVFHTAGAQKRVKQTLGVNMENAVNGNRNEIGSRGDESLGIESTYRFKGRGSDFQNGSPPMINQLAVNDEPFGENGGSRVNHYIQYSNFVKQSGQNSSALNNQ